MTDAPSAVAVVIPCYRQARFLGDALASVAAQTHAAAEVVVVDDGSPDDVVGAAAPFAGVRVVRQENRGLPGARNRGLAEVGSPFVVFLDADDRLLPHALETNLQMLEAHPDAAFAWGFNRPFHDDGRPLPWGPTTFEGEPTYARLLETNVVGSPLGVMFRRERVVEAGGFALDAPACEDYDLYLRLAREHPYVCAHRIVAEYRHHGENMSGDRELMYRTFVDVLSRQAPHVAGDPALEAALARGRRDARRRYRAPAHLDRLARHVEEGRWGAALGTGLHLAVRHPGSLIVALRDRLRPRERAPRSSAGPGSGPTSTSTSA